MKYLFKEIWKSFKNSKILLGGLIFLVFLTSGIVNLLFAVVNTYNKNYDYYKQTSILQDLTMSANIEPKGSRPDDFYSKYEDKSVPNVWQFQQPIRESIQSIQIQTKDPYINLKQAGLNDSIDSFVDVKDLSYLINANANKLQESPDGKFKTFTPDEKQAASLKLYQPNLADPKADQFDYALLQELNTINKIENNAPVQISKIKDLMKYNQQNPVDFYALLIDVTKPTEAVIENEQFLKSNAAVVETYKKNPNGFLRIEPIQVAKWFGFTKANLVQANYAFDKAANFSAIDGALNAQEIEQWSKSKDPLKLLAEKTPAAAIKLNQNEAFGPNQDVIKVAKTLLLNPNQTLKIPTSWFVYDQATLIFQNNKYQLNLASDFANDQHWGKIYRDYFQTLNPAELQAMRLTSSWTKTLTNNLVDQDGNVIKKGKILKVNMLAKDLDLPLTPVGGQANQPAKTILQIENINKPSETNQINKLVKVLNQDQHILLENKIEQGTKKLAYENLFKEMKTLVNKIGFRQTLTVNDNQDGQTNVFQLINIGDANQQFSWQNNKINQEVGKLINARPDSKIFSFKSNVEKNAKQVPIRHMAKLLNIMFGSAVDRDYVNAMVSFEQFRYKKNPNDKNYTTGNGKIIWLTPNGVNDRSQLWGINATFRPFRIHLLKESKPGQRDWIEQQQFEKIEQLDEYLTKKNPLNFAPFDYNNQPIQVVNETWLRKEPDFSDRFSVPVQTITPSAEILEEFNKFQSLNGFSEFLIAKFTETIQPLISPDNFAIIANAIASGFARSGFGSAITPPATLTEQTIIKMIIFALYDTTQATNQNFLNNFFNDLLNNFKHQLIKFSDPAQKKQYFRQQIDKLGLLLNAVMGLDRQLLLNLVDAIENPENLIDFLVGFTNALDIDQIIINVYQSLTDPNRKANQAFGNGDLLPYIFLNLKNPEGLKTAITTFLGQINVKKLLEAFKVDPQLIGLIQTFGIINQIKKTLTIENGAIGYSKLLQQSTFVEKIVGSGADAQQIFYKDIALKPFFNLITMKPIPIIGTVMGLGDILETLGVLPKTKKANQQFNQYALPQFVQTYANDGSSWSTNLSFDLDLIWFGSKYAFDQKDPTIFGLDARSILEQVVFGFSNLVNNYKSISFEENANKIALVNEAYLQANNKAVYQSNNIEKDVENLDKIDQRYKIKINGLEYLIIGSDLTVDYMYPVINGDNLQVNPKNQALVYVNQNGFDRMKREAIGAPLDSYFLLKDPVNLQMSPRELQTKLNQMIYRWTNDFAEIKASDANDNLKNPFKKAYLVDELALFNPERALRINTINSLINLLNNAELMIAIVLAIIISIVLAFVIRRYIVSRAKAIGILKSQGYSNFQIALSLCSFALITAVVGGILGTLLGYLTQGLMFQLLAIFWTIPIVMPAFNFGALFLSIGVPFVALTALIFGTTYWVLRKNPVTLMNASLEVNDTISAKKIQQSIRRANIKTKYSVALSLSSIGKLSALFLTTVVASTITLFSTTLFNVFNKTINETYDNREFSFKTDLVSPTIEGGKYSDLKLINNQQQVNMDQMLYVPIGILEEGYTYKKNYFEPGFNPVMNSEIIVGQSPNGLLIKKPANGILDPNDLTTPHIFTKSSLDLLIQTDNASVVNIWSTFYEYIPESQRSLILNASDQAAKWLEWSQEGTVYWENNQPKYVTQFVNYLDKDLQKEYLGLFDISGENPKVVTWFNPQTNKIEPFKLPYFKYLKTENDFSKNHFEFRKPVDGKYFENKIIINGEVENAQVRMLYREFLVKGYQQMINFTGEPKPLVPTPSPMPSFALDYFVTSGANGFAEFNKTSDETYTYIDTIMSNNVALKPRIYGYNEASKFVQINDKNGNNLLAAAQRFSEQNQDVYPLVINNVVQQKYRFNVGDQFDFEVQNHFLRFENQLAATLDKINGVEPTDATRVAKPKIKMRIIGISNTHINEEWVTLQKVANEITGLKNSYNGIFTNMSQPVQLGNALTLYAPNGYWAAGTLINNSELNVLSKVQFAENLNVYKELFYDPDLGDGHNRALVAKHISNLLKTTDNKQINQAIKQILKLDPNETLASIMDNPSKIYQALEEFKKIYSNTAMIPAVVNMVSNGVEKGFVIKTSDIFNSAMVIIISLAFVLVLVILIMVTVLILNENQINIAVFNVLGYSNREIIRMFFSIYLPIILAAILTSVLIVWLMLPTFISAMLATTAIALPISINFGHILVTTLIITGIFSLSCWVIWKSQNRVKAINHLQAS